MRPRPILGLVVSAALHGAVASTALLLVTRTASLPPLFVDLTVDAEERGVSPDGRVSPPVAASVPGSATAPPAARTSRAAAAISAPASGPRRPPPPAAAPSTPFASFVPQPDLAAPAPPSPLRTIEPQPVTPAPQPLPHASPPLPPPASAARTPPPPASRVVQAETSTSLPPLPLPPVAPSEASTPTSPTPAPTPAAPVHMVPAARMAGESAARGSRAGTDAAIADARPPASATRTASGPAASTMAGPARAASGVATRDGAGESGRAQQLARATPGDASREPGAEHGPWLRSLRGRIQSSLRYPATARRRGISGTVTLEMTIQPSGAIEDVRVIESSSHGVLDSAAVEGVRGLAAQPMPGNLEQRTLRVRLPVVFQLH